MFVRAMIVWAAIIPIAIANGALRAAWIIPRTGAAVGHVVSSVTLSLAIVAVAWLAIPWIAPPTPRDAWLVGVAWLAATVVFEFGFGRFVAGKTWAELLADYNVLRGRVWVLVLLATGTAPALAAAWRGLAGGR